jgi:predicted Fe-Mo cluster-binding NifX family protein/ferredoxin
MKVAVTASEPSLTARVDPRFGRCPYFLVMETEDGSFQAVENPNLALGGGAGIQSAQLMAEQGVQAVLTGNCGPNAYQALSAAGIGVMVGCSGTVAQVVEQLKTGQLNAAGQPNVGGKFGIGGVVDSRPGPALPSPQPGTAGRAMGMGPGAGRGLGRGMGRGGGSGRGGGGGRGLGRGLGRGRGMGAGAGAGAGYGVAPVPMPQQPAQSPPGQQELATLKQQAEAVSQQMRQIQERIRQLEGTGQAGRTAAVEPEKCTGCGLCVEACPVEAIAMADGRAAVDAQACTGCRTCVETCPNEAISMV